VVYLKSKNFEIFRCNSCTNAWTSPPPEAIDYESRDFHKLEISTKNDAIKSITNLPNQWQRSIQQQLALIQNHVPKKASILEIGCGEGIFLMELKKDNYITFGIEPSKSAAERAVISGLEVVQGYFPNDLSSERKYDLVILSHVLEHLEKPTEIIEAIKNVLSPHGKVLLIQTNYEGIIPRLLQRRWYAWVYDQHYWHFTPAGIINIAEKVGLKKVEYEFSSLVHYDKGFSIRNFVFRLINLALIFLPNNRKDQFHLMLSIK
jgi:2-polyprenyl-3-methyl-5-hydroxy-6-metoxy-1,4-benzoquinol methylase